MTRIEKKYICALTADCVIFGYDQNELKVLCIKCNTPPFVGKYSLLGEFVLTGETMDDAAKRILKKWTGLDNLYLEEVKVFSELERHPEGRVITVAYYSLMKIGEYEIQDAENKGLQWLNFEDAKDLAYDHDIILETSLERLKTRLREKPIGFNLLPKKFSLNQLQNLYETVLDISIDKRNFRRKLSTLELLIDLNENQNNVLHRPAKLYSFDFEKFRSIKKKGILNFDKIRPKK